MVAVKKVGFVSVILDTFGKVERELVARDRVERIRMQPSARESRAIQLRRARSRSFKVLTVTSNKGGVGKTTMASRG